MKGNLSLFVFSAILVISMGITPAFAQNTISVTTDKTSYFEGETIIITGKGFWATRGLCCINSGDSS